MKKTIKTLSVLALALALLLGLSAVAFAESSVSYKGGAEKFVFLEGGAYTDTDMFGGFKGVMPGDELTQKVTVRNSFTDVEYVKIYLRAVPHGVDNALSENVAAGTDLAAMQDFLSQLSMTVKQGDKLLFSASPAELGGLSDKVLIGAFQGNASVDLTVTLSVPEELGNEYMDNIGEVDWEFTAEEIPYTKPKTGDESSLTLWLAVMGASLLIVAAAVFFFIKKKKKAE
ncbi:MAG: LPXTG cell wall anchor domain-containing protein [Oscillospiraceae bacterium]|nr:LPXTG cell wall anchor domain-containing protein [Oscillospiraceae bacterium]